MRGLANEEGLYTEFPEHEVSSNHGVKSDLYEHHRRTRPNVFDGKVNKGDVELFPGRKVEDKYVKLEPTFKFQPQILMSLFHVERTQTDGKGTTFHLPFGEILTQFV